MIYDTVRAWATIGTEYKVNFDTRPVTKWKKEQILEQWSQMTTDEINMDFLSALERVITKDHPTSRDLYLHKMGKLIQQCVKDARGAGSRCEEWSDSDSLLPLEAFVGMDTVTCRTFDVVTGALVSFTLHAWFAEYCNTHTLVLHGDAGLGKTPLSKSMLGAIASRLSNNPMTKAYYIKVGTLDALRDSVYSSTQLETNNTVMMS